ncbi:MAG: hypothetical protein EOO46_24720, partial [Flavobacterium sp.]
MNERIIEPFEILLSRFEWMSPLVRERAARKISELLEMDKSGKISVAEIDVNKVVAWKNGKFVFEEEDIESI